MVSDRLGCDIGARWLCTNVIVSSRGNFNTLNHEMANLLDREMLDVYDVLAEWISCRLR
jgi:hypothetical protein